jgi:hypothetical protein
MFEFSGEGRAVKQTIVATNSFLNSFSFWNYTSGTVEGYMQLGTTFSVFSGNGATFTAGYSPFPQALFTTTVDPNANGKVTILFGAVMPLEIGETYSITISTFMCGTPGCAGPSSSIYNHDYGVDMSTGNWYDEGKAYSSLFDRATLTSPATISFHNEYAGDLRFEMVQSDVAFPEPSTLLLTISGLLLLAVGRNRIKYS